eukprot:6213709-Pleurochrysis_carterae.AAC.2
MLGKLQYVLCELLWLVTNCYNCTSAENLVLLTHAFSLLLGCVDGVGHASSTKRMRDVRAWMPQVKRGGQVWKRDVH